MKIANIIPETYVDGPGLRYSIYVSGCENNCPGCHNKQLQDFSVGENLSIRKQLEIRKEILSNPLLTGVTISGGDPFHPNNVRDLYELLLELDSITNSIWVYTGYKLEELLARNRTRELQCLSLIDVLVDGKYEKDNPPTLPFRGSNNQRSIKVKEMASHNFLGEVKDYLRKII